MNHGVVEVFAYQETLLIMAVLGIAILAMVWIGFRRWLQYKERMGRLLGERAADQRAKFDAQMERIEARLNAIQQIVTNGGVETAAQIERSTSPEADRIPKPGSLRANP